MDKASAHGAGDCRFAAPSVAGSVRRHCAANFCQCCSAYWGPGSQAFSRQPARSTFAGCSTQCCGIRPAPLALLVKKAFAQRSRHNITAGAADEIHLARIELANIMNQDRLTSRHSLAIDVCRSCRPSMHCWAEAPIKIARMTLTIKLDRNWSRDRKSVV